MLIGILIGLNIPLYLVIGWLVFDTKDDAIETFWQTIVAILKRALVPRILRYMLWEEEDDATGIVPILIFFVACIALTYGEYYLLTKFVWPGLA